jgi:hypothetical protein
MLGILFNSLELIGKLIPNHLLLTHSLVPHWKTMSADQEVQVWERKTWIRISLKVSEYSLQKPSFAPL